MNLFISIRSANESVQSASTLAVSPHLLSTQLIQAHITHCILHNLQHLYLQPVHAPLCLSIFFSPFEQRIQLQKN